MVLNIETIFSLMLRQGWSERELARRAGISEATVSRILSGQRGAGPKTTAGLLRAFPNVPPDKLYRCQ